MTAEERARLIPMPWKFDGKDRIVGHDHDELCRRIADAIRAAEQEAKAEAEKGIRDIVIATQATGRKVANRMVAEEREACAKIAESPEMCHGWDSDGDEIAAAIRQRGESEIHVGQFDPPLPPFTKPVEPVDGDVSRRW